MESKFLKKHVKVSIIVARLLKTEQYLLWKFWTHESFQKYIKHDRPGEQSLSTTVLYRTAFPWKIMLNLLKTIMKELGYLYREKTKTWIFLFQEAYRMHDIEKNMCCVLPVEGWEALQWQWS